MRSLLVSIVLLLVITAAWVINSKPVEFVHGINDYFSFYGGAKLLPSGQLYDAAAMQELQIRTLGGVMPNVLYIRPPFEALLLCPLALLPYSASYWTYQALSLAAVIVFMLLYRREVPEIVPLAGVSFPLACAFLNGQDVPFILLAAGAGMLLFHRGREVAAGLVLALCSTKPHLFAFVALAFLLHRRWRVIAGGAIGVTVLVGLSFLAAGRDWPARFLETIANPAIHPNPAGMGNLYALANGFTPLLAWTYVPLLLLTAGAFLYLAFRDHSTERVVAYGLVAGLLAGRHAFCQDYSLLLLFYVLLYPYPEAVNREWLRWLCLPFLYLGLVSQTWLGAALPLALMAFLGLAAARLSPLPLRTPQPAPRMP